MNRRILFQVTAPALLIGLLLTATTMVTAWYVNELQVTQATSLRQNVPSLEAARRLEISLRQMRFNYFLYQIDPRPEILSKINRQEKEFERWLIRAKRTSSTVEESNLIRDIQMGYDRYHSEFDRNQLLVAQNGPRRDFQNVDDANPVHQIADDCHELYAFNEAALQKASAESERIGQRLRGFLWLLGVLGPLGGLTLGFGIARGLSRSIHRLNVHVKDLSQRLDQDVGSVEMPSSHDLNVLDGNLAVVARQVEQLVEERQARERELTRSQQMAALGQLASGVAHEIRNPLTGIKLLVDAAVRPSRPKPLTPENLDVIRTEIHRLDQIVQSFIDFARPPALERSECDLREVVDQALGLIRFRADQQDVSIGVSLPDVPVVHRVDRGQLASVLVNLCLNALDAMPKGGKLEVALERKGERAVSFRVADTGRGVAPEVAGRLFTPFTTTKPAGTGLGLCIAKRVVEDHHGSIRFEPCPEGGASFVIQIPLQTASAPASGTGADPNASETRPN